MSSSSFEIAKALLENGPSRSTLFSFETPKLQPDLTRYLDLFCTTTTLPGVHYNSLIAAGHEHMGIAREIPSMIVWERPLTLQIISDSDAKIYRAMRSWFNECSVNANQATKNRSQRMKYYNSYVSPLTLHKLENIRDGVDVFNVKVPLFNFGQPFIRTLSTMFFNTWPIRIGELELDQADFNGIVTFTVEFAYESYHMTQLTTPYGLSPL